MVPISSTNSWQERKQAYFPKFWAIPLNQIQKGHANRIFLNYCASKRRYLSMRTTPEATWITIRDTGWCQDCQNSVPSHNKPEKSKNNLYFKHKWLWNIERSLNSPFWTCKWTESEFFLAGDLCRVTDLSDFGVAQLVRSQPAEGSVQLQQLQRMAVQPLANQETWKARRQEEEGADVSLGWPCKQTERQTDEIFHWCSGSCLLHFMATICECLFVCAGFAHHMIHAHPLYTQRGSREQTPNSKDVRHSRVFSILDLQMDRESAFPTFMEKLDTLSTFI